MSEKRNGVSMRVPVKNRRARVLERLEAQLKTGEKVHKNGVEIHALTDSDIKRINKEIETLKKRI